MLQTAVVLLLAKSRSCEKQARCQFDGQEVGQEQHERAESRPVGELPVQPARGRNAGHGQWRNQGHRDSNPGNTGLQRGMDKTKGSGQPGGQANGQIEKSGAISLAMKSI